MRPRRTSFVSSLLLFAIAGCAGKSGKFSSGTERFERVLASSPNLSFKTLKTQYEIACKEKSAAACFILKKPLPSIELARLPLAQGATNESSTQISLLHDSDDAPEVSLVDKSTLISIPVRDIQRRGYPAQSKTWTWVRFNGLKLNHSYALVVTHSDGKLWDLRTLAALNPKKKTIRFAVASCMDDYYHEEQMGMWRDLLSQKPDMLFLIGDNVYGDKMSLRFIPANGAQLWNRYVETWTALELYKAEQLVPIFQTWDDHDFGINDGDRDFPYKEQAKDVMNRVFAREMVTDFYSVGPGVSSTFKMGGQQFILTDGRSFRSPAKAADETHWGKEQEEWIFGLLGKSDSPTWLIEGDQFFGGYHPFESYEGRQPTSFKQTIERIKKVKQPVFFLSGDRHNTELMKVTDLGYTTYEFTTSPIHAKVFPEPWTSTPNPRQIAAAAEVFNYGIIESRVSGGKWEMLVSAFGPNKRSLYSKRLTVTK